MNRSNDIEGTTFTVEEAEDIVFHGRIIENRSEDSHDVLGAFNAAITRPWPGLDMAIPQRRHRADAAIMKPI